MYPLTSTSHPSGLLLGVLISWHFHTAHIQSKQAPVAQESPSGRESLALALGSLGMQRNNGLFEVR